MKEAVYKSKNRYKEFLRAAKIISKKISTIPGVVGILATGGIGRGHCDHYSDLDLIVYVTEKKLRELDKLIAVGWLCHKGIDLDTPVESYDRALKRKSPSSYWSQVMRWDRGNSKILFDSKNRMRNLLEEKLVFPDWEQKKLMRKHSHELTDHLIYGFEMWEKRGGPANVAHELIQAAEHLILWIYAKNKKFQPYRPKWLFYHLENGSVPEAKYLEAIRSPFVEPLKKRSDARKIRKDLIALCDRLGVPLDYRSVDEILERCSRNWPNAPEKTRYYLSW
jgi:hypothetical protein